MRVENAVQTGAIETSTLKIAACYGDNIQVH